MTTNSPEYQRAWYQKNREKVIKASSVRNKANKTSNRLFLNEIKSTTPCADCGLLYHPCIMEFDHTGNDKYMAIADLMSKGVSMKRLMEEISKCELVCANCHRLRTCSRSKVKVH